MPAIDPLFEAVVADGASDLHLHVGREPHYRVNGSLVKMPRQRVLTEAGLVSMLLEICPPERWEAFASSGDLDFAYAWRDGLRFRVNYRLSREGCGAVFRLIPNKIQSLEAIGAPPALKQFALFRSGLVLVTGPTGSGKSTTLAALIDYINSTERRFILTIEDPIEFIHQNKESTISQREVGTDVESFSAALRNAVRQDVQVVLVGEMRDLETVRLAITAAEMGMLVYATMHTNSAIKTIDRIVDIFPADEQANMRESLAVSLRAVCSQRLLKRTDGRGRVAAHEILIQTPAVSNLIRENKTIQINQVILSNRAMGMQLLDDQLLMLARSGVITGEDAYRKADNKEPFREFAPEGRL
ncbi:MAG: PilT/PilU family type 4a pilus ATPase [Candidatus Sumerlaeaceae bacterium]|nr:PilT/PilU family type 4a pilus ATPase [Candidatus Sumerlaeaceae bacterium]